MKNIAILLCVFIATYNTGLAQKVENEDSGKVTTIKDARIDALGKKMAEFNDVPASAIKNVKGYRLQVVNSTDREYAMKVRGKLLQNYADQKVYMTFQSPYIKLKFGNFAEKDEAERYKKLLIKGNFITGNIYVVPDVVEIKTEKKEKEKEEEKRR